MNLTKAQRESLRLKFDGKCAYCGQDLGSRWHADHFKAIFRDRSKHATRPHWRPENDVLENMMPSCAPCNISKATLPIEDWRKWLALHLKSLNERVSIYRLVKAHGLVVETGKPIVFYFETMSQ